MRSASQAARVSARLAQRLKSQRGASFSIALLALLVCVVISAIVIAAATASAGWMADRGEMDQKYYSVTSAAQLFQSSIGEGDECKFTFVQEKTGTRDERAADPDAITYAKKDDSAALTVIKAMKGKQDISTSSGFDFLARLTTQLIFGQDTLTNISKVPSGADWYRQLSPMTGKWTGNSEGRNYYQYSYTVAPKDLGDSADFLAVAVTARLWDDWFLELEFTNMKNGAPDTGKDSYHLYMSLAANVSEDLQRYETTDGTEVDGSVASTQVNVFEDFTTSVTWKLQQIVPGRGLANV